MILSSFIDGIGRARENPRLNVFLFLVNLLSGIVLTFPLYRRLMGDIGHSLLGENLLHGFDYAWFAEFRYENSVFLDSIDSLILPVAIGYLFLWSILSGGILEVFKPGSETPWSRRFSLGVARHILPFFRLTLISSVLYLLVYWLLLIKGWVRVMDWIEDSPSPQLEALAGIGITLLATAAVLFLDMIFDYTRIRRVIEGNRSIVLSIFEAVGFCLKHFRRTVGLYALLLVVSGAWIVIYLALYPLIPQHHLTGIVLLFLIQETFMLGRIFLRTASYSSQMAFYLRATSIGTGDPE